MPAFSYTKDNVRWSRAEARGGLAKLAEEVCTDYGRKEAPYWVEASFGYTYDHVKAHRNLSLFSEVPFVAPINARLSHKENSHTYMGHIGGSYDIYRECYADAEIGIWPYFNVDCIYAKQPSFREKGNARSFLLKKSRKKTIHSFYLKLESELASVDLLLRL